MKLGGIIYVVFSSLPAPWRGGWMTLGEMPFEAALTELSKVPVYQAITEQAVHLHLLGMNPNRIAVHLGVDRKTVSRALRWIRSL